MKIQTSDARISVIILSWPSFSQTARLMKTVKGWSKKPEPYKEASMAALNIIIL